MRKQTGLILALLVLALTAALALPQVAFAEVAFAAETGFTKDFRIEECTWSAWGRENRYMSLRPGRQLVLEGEEDGTEIRAEVTMLPQTETIHFVTAKGVPLTVVTRVMEEREFEDGEIVEVSRNWVARCVQTSNIFYFGEEVDIYEDGVLVGHEGAWRAGVDGAQPGLLMPGSFLLGSRYFMEQAPGSAEDRGENVRMGFGVATPAGNFTECVQVNETNPLSSNPNAVDVKIFCPGVGIVRDESLVLVFVGVV